MRSVLFIQFLSVCTVVAYYQVAGFQSLMDRIGAAKGAHPILFAFFSSVVAGSLIPEIVKTLMGDREWDKRRLADSAHNALMFAVNGVVCERFYWVMGIWYGTDNSVGTVVKKILTDSFGYSPFVSLPIFVGLTLLRLNNGNPVRLVKSLNKTILVERYAPMLLPMWIYWIPLQACIYVLPPNLQFPFAQLCVAAWSLVLVFVVNRHDLHRPEKPVELASV